jgi:hypothetical protein
MVRPAFATRFDSCRMTAQKKEILVGAIHNSTPRFCLVCISFLLPILARKLKTNSERLSLEAVFWKRAN